MRQTSLRLAIVTSLVFPAAQFAVAQGVLPGVQRGGAATAPGRDADARGIGGPGAAGRDSRILQSSLIIGAPVMLQGGASYGTVQDFVIGDGGCIQYAVINYNNGLVPIPWGVGMFDSGRRAFMVDISRDRVREFPTIHQISELNNPQFTQRVQTFYRGNNQPNQNRTDANRPQMNQQRGAQNPTPAEHGEANRGNAPRSAPARSAGNGEHKK
jgi:hypothetical protein